MNCTRRTIVTDANGKEWDLGNPNILAIEPDGATPPQTTIDMWNGVQFISVPIAFSVAFAAFNAS